MDNRRKKSDEEQVKQSPQSLTVQEGEMSILNWSYEKGAFDYLLWYWQYSGKDPAFLIAISSVMNEMKMKFSVSLNKSAKQLLLYIATSQPRDSATYICAPSAWYSLGTCSLYPNLQLSCSHTLLCRWNTHAHAHKICLVLKILIYLRKLKLYRIYSSTKMEMIQNI